MTPPMTHDFNIQGFIFPFLCELHQFTICSETLVFVAVAKQLRSKRHYECKCFLFYSVSVTSHLCSSFISFLSFKFIFHLSSFF